MVKSPVVVNAVRAVVEELGVHNISIKKVTNRLQWHALTEVLSASTVRLIMMHHFGLLYRYFDSGNFKYSSRYFDEKRRTICRIIATLLREDVYVVCID